jgi:hypothetical protein
MGHQTSAASRRPCALTIATTDSGGGAGIAADLRTFHELGVHGTCVVAAATGRGPSPPIWDSRANTGLGG